MNICHPRRKAHACIFMMRREGDGPSRSSACARPASGMSGSTRGGPKCAAPTGFLSASAFGSLGGDRSHRRRTARLSLFPSKNPCKTNDKGELSRLLHDGQGFSSVLFRVRERLLKVAGIRSAFNLLCHARTEVDVSPFFVLKTKDISFSGRSLTWFFNVCCDGRGKQKRVKCRQLQKCFLPL